MALARRQVEVTGLAELERNLKALPDRVAKKVLRSAMRSGANIVKKEAQRRAPRGDSPDSPFLAEHIIVRTPKRRAPSSRKFAVLVLVRPGRGAAYGLPLEFGTQTMAPRPFLRPALEAAAPQALAKIKRQVGRGIEREAAKLGRGA